jgi:hypothetical protein
MRNGLYNLLKMNKRMRPLIHTLLEFAPAQYVESPKKAEPKLRSVLWKMIPPLNSLYYLGVLKILHFEPHAERFEHETPLWF